MSPPPNGMRTILYPLASFPSPLPCKAIDSTGGGDTFMAGFLSEYLRSADPVRSGQWGGATAACVIERTGGVSAARMPAFEEIKKRLEREGK